MASPNSGAALPMTTTSDAATRRIARIKAVTRERVYRSSLIGQRSPVFGDGRRPFAGIRAQERAPV